MRLSWLLAASICTLAGCTRTTPVSLVNRSGAPLEDVVIIGSGFQQSIGAIPAGATAEIPVNPSGESGLGLSFRSRGRKAILPVQGYFEGGGNYSVSAVVMPDLSVTINASLRY